MPRLANKLPSYRFHRASGQAVVTLNGRDVYLGNYNTDESRDRYKLVIQEWLAGERQLPPSGPTGSHPRTPGDITINEIFLPYWEHAQQYYRKNGKPTREVGNIKAALAPLLDVYGTYPARDFGPLALKAYQKQLVEGGFTRTVINKKLSRVKQFFKWGVENEMIDPRIYHGVSAVSGLRYGRTKAYETDPVKPAPDHLVDKILGFLTPTLQAMVELQQFTGMHPNKLCIIRTCDIDTSGKTWIYRPYQHKIKHHGRERLVYIGPKAQRILQPYLCSSLTTYIFSPENSEEEGATINNRVTLPETQKQTPAADDATTDR